MIDYSRIGRAVDFYRINGYSYIQVPWLVSEAINNITRPVSASQYFVTKDNKRKTFVASGEQGFLYLISKGQLPPGKYVTVTPCIRNDDFDETHVKYFQKVELIEFGTPDMLTDSDAVYDSMANIACKFFELELPPEERWRIEQVKTDIGFDVEFSGIEVGSYGVRDSMLTKWAYGTGLAEPRFTRVLNFVNSFNKGSDKP